MLNTKAGFLRLLEVLDGLAVRFMIVGSLASSAYGNYRSTNDIDIVAEIKEQDITRLGRYTRRHNPCEAGMVSSWRRTVRAPVERFARDPLCARKSIGQCLHATVGGAPARQRFAGSAAERGALT